MVELVLIGEHYVKKKSLGFALPNKASSKRAHLI